MIFDRCGSVATTKRHDCAPFGEKLFNGAGTTAMGYAAADSTCQKFSQKERDIETGLDYLRCGSARTKSKKKKLRGGRYKGRRAPDLTKEEIEELARELPKIKN